MEKLFDLNGMQNVTEINESYAYYGDNKICDMDQQTLKNELKRIENDIKTLQDEIENAGSFPSYVLKERLKDADEYRQKIQKKLSEFPSDGKTEKSKNTLHKMNEMKKDLERQYEKGMITKDYRDKYVSKINDSIEAYKVKVERERAEEEERQKKEENKKHKFKLFKRKLQDYKK